MIVLWLVLPESIACESEKSAEDVFIRGGLGQDVLLPCIVSPTELMINVLRVFRTVHKWV